MTTCAPHPPTLLLQELREQLEAIGEATLLPPTESEKRAPKFPSQGEVVQFMQVGRGRGGRQPFYMARGQSAAA